ncbi:helix-turn-helix domain-containing protein [Empedobacter sedimenti]|uniref:helix-turn-helix domain-containing protein n=1 Tax=Empedobacter sedimenti TaxID=3042610 RepID=UPI0024A7909B|nr:helix-turn-helix domain-containing protein [Empedobacter sedimenti]
MAQDSIITKQLTELFNVNYKSYLNVWEKEYLKLEEDEYKIKILTLTSNVYLDEGNVEKVIELNNRAIKIAEKNKFAEPLIYTYIASAKNYFALNMYDQGDKALEQAQNNIIRVKDQDIQSELQIKIHHVQANSYTFQKKYLDANKYYVKAIDEAIKVKKPDVELRLYNDLGYNYFLMKEFNLSQKTYEKGLHLQSIIKDDIIFAILKGNLGILAYQNNDYKLALNYFEQSVPVLEENDFINELIENYHILGLIYSNQKEHKKAGYYYQKERKLLNQLSENEKKGVYLVLNNIEKEYQSNLKKQFWWSISIIGILAIGLVTLFYFYKKRKKNITNNPITLSHKEKRKISDTIIQDTLLKLELFEKSTKYTNPNLSLASLASEFNINSQYLSEIINTYKHKNFNMYINELRIQLVKKKLNDSPKHRQYKIAILAEESGFQSHSSFTKSFKQIEGISPSDYIEQIIVKNSPKH